MNFVIFPSLLNHIVNIITKIIISPLEHQMLSCTTWFKCLWLETHCEEMLHFTNYDLYFMCLLLSKKIPWSESSLKYYIAWPFKHMPTNDNVNTSVKVWEDTSLKANGHQTRRIAKWAWFLWNLLIRKQMMVWRILSEIISRIPTEIASIRGW